MLRFNNLQASRLLWVMKNYGMILFPFLFFFCFAFRCLGHSGPVPAHRIQEAESMDHLCRQD